MKIPDVDLLALACEFDLGPEPVINGVWCWWQRWPESARRQHVYAKNMGNPNNKPHHDCWGIFREGYTSCLNKLGEWEYQGMPSGRETDFYKRCRYSSAHEAIAYYFRWRAAIAQWAKDKNIAPGSDRQEDIINYGDIPVDILKF